jgi:hypothetical protein
MWLSGGWERRLRPLARILAQQKYQGFYLDAVRELSQRIAVIELVPYHSVTFHEHRLVRFLRSTTRAREFVHEHLLQRAKAGRALIVVMRKVSAWGFSHEQKLDGVVVYPSGLARGSSLAANSPGGMKILARLGIRHQ